MAFDEFDILHPAELSKPGHVGLAKWLSVIATALLFVEFLRGMALGHADRLGREALRRTAEATRAQAAGAADSLFAAAALAEAREASARAGAAYEAALTAEPGTAERRIQETEIARWNAVLAFLENQHALPHADEVLAREASRHIDADIDLLRADAASERESFWHGKVRWYAVATTLLAIAIVLIGLAFVLPGSRRNFKGVALLVAGAGAIVTGLASLPGEPITSEEAIMRTAQGKAEFAAGRPEAALAEYNEALLLRDDYAEALARRAEARFATAAARFRPYGDGQSLDPIIEESALDAYIEDLQRARAAGRELDAGLMEQLGYAYMLDGDFAQASRLVDKALDRAPREPQFWFDRAVISAVTGDDAGHRARRDAGNAAILLNDPQELTYQARVREQYARARTALEYVRRGSPQDAAGKALAEQLLLDQMRLESRIDIPASPLPGTLVSELTFSFGSVGPPVRATVVLAGVPSDEPVALIWSFRPAPNAPWRELVEGFELRPAGQPSQQAALPRGCPSSGEYRLAVVVRGRVIGDGSAATPVGFPSGVLCP